MRIRCAALRKGDKVYIGRYHGEIFSQRPKGELKDAEQGFVTDSGIFVNRYQALEIAEKAGQIVEKHRPWDKLMSEDFKCEL